MSNPAISDAIAQVKAAAGNLPAETGNVINYVPQAAARPSTLSDNLVGSFAVDTWLKVKPYGMTIGKDTTTLFDRLTFRIDLSAVAYCRRVRFGNPAEYRSTYDGVNDDMVQGRCCPVWPIEATGFGRVVVPSTVLAAEGFLMMWVHTVEVSIRTAVPDVDLAVLEGFTEPKGVEEAGNPPLDIGPGPCSLPIASIRNRLDP